MCVCPVFFLSSFYLHPEHGGLRAVGRYLPLLLLLQLRLLLGNPFQPGKGWLSAGRRLPVPPAARSLGTRRVDRLSGGGGEDGGPSGSHCLGQRQPATEVFPLLYTPIHSASSRGCRVPPVPILPWTPISPPNLPAQREPEKEAGAGALPRTTPGKSRELERNLHQVAAGAAPLCARRSPALQLSPQAT